MATLVFTDVVVTILEPIMSDSNSEKETLQDFDLSIFILLDAGEDDKQSWLLVEDSRNKSKYRVTIEKIEEIEEQDVSSK